MGRQAYLTRLVLGRSPYDPPSNLGAHGVQGDFDHQNTDPRNNQHEHSPAPVPQASYSPIRGYVQQFDRYGHPENLVSESLARESRNAQNDILATVGVCRRTERMSQDSQSDYLSVQAPSMEESGSTKKLLAKSVNILVTVAGIATSQLFIGSIHGLSTRLQV
ncbi:MAG: hypothetical protein LQ351_007389 [Letrouitia transgressa]|nr:MAG: hypothetical protein LQ351_007389 [Letrouitia transgressa]